MGLYGTVYFIFSSVSLIAISLGLFFMIGIIAAYVDVTYGIYLQKTVDIDKIGRVYSIDMALSNLLIVLVTSVITLVGDKLDSVLSIKVLSISMIVTVLVTLVTKSYSKLDEMDQKTVKELSSIKKKLQTSNIIDQ